MTDQEGTEMETLEQLKQMSFAANNAFRELDAITAFKNEPDWISEVLDILGEAIDDLSEKISNYGTRHTVVDGATVAVSKHVEL